MIDAKRIEEMKRLSEGAATGEWIYDKSENEIRCGEYLIAKDTDYEADAQFIAESRQFVPDIIAAYEEQAKEIDKQRLELRCSSDVQMGVIKKQAEEIARLRKALASIQLDCDLAKECYIEESDIDGILETVKEALK